MTASLGSTVCPHLGCQRKRYVTPGGTTYSGCLAHTLMRLSGAFRPVAPLSVAPTVPPAAPRGAEQAVTA